MTDKKLTDNEIIKALECCSKKICKQCPNFSEDIECSEKLINLTLDYITRQQAEIERLKTNLNIELENFATEYDNKIKSEAYKECIKKVKNYIKAHCNPYGKPDFDYDTSIKILNFIDKLAKEMVGDDNA